MTTSTLNRNDSPSFYHLLLSSAMLIGVLGVWAAAANSLRYYVLGASLVDISQYIQESWSWWLLLPGCLLGAAMGCKVVYKVYAAQSATSRQTIRVTILVGTLVLWFASGMFVYRDFHNWVPGEVLTQASASDACVRDWVVAQLKADVPVTVSQLEMYRGKCEYERKRALSVTAKLEAQFNRPPAPSNEVLERRSVSSRQLAAVEAN